jgi:transposase InsO family protein
MQHLERYGSFNILTSDNGPEYANQVIDDLLKIAGIEHHFTMAYSKEENAIVERANKEVGRYLRDIIFDRGLIDKWSIVVPLVQRIINSSTHWVTGVSPAKILFGNSVDLDRGIFLEHIPGTPTEKLSIWISKMLDI